MIRAIKNTCRPIPLIKEAHLSSCILDQYDELHTIADPDVIFDAGRYFKKQGIAVHLVPANLMEMMCRFSSVGFVRNWYITLWESQSNCNYSLSRPSLFADAELLPTFCTSTVDRFAALDAEFVEHNPHWAQVGHIGHPIYVNANLGIPTLHFVKELYESSDKTVCSASTVYLPIDTGQPVEYIRIRRNKVIPELMGNPNDTYIEAQVIPLLNGKKAFAFLHRCAPNDVPRCHISTTEMLAEGSYELCDVAAINSIHAKQEIEERHNLNLAG